MSPNFKTLVSKHFPSLKKNTTLSSVKHQSAYKKVLNHQIKKLNRKFNNQILIILQKIIKRNSVIETLFNVTEIIK